MTETGHSPTEISADQNTPSYRGAWQPRSVAIRESVEKYSRFVSAMKVLLPSVAGLLLALVFILPQLRGEPEQLTADIAITTDNGGALSLVNARYLGTDTSGQPFTVTAESVREADGGDDNIDLTAPQADISLNDGTWLMVGADTGRYHRESQTLNLEGAVNLFQDQGYQLHTESAVILLEQGTATSSMPVQTQGPFGRLESQGFDLQDKGKVVFFTGPAKLVLDSAGNGSGGQ